MKELINVVHRETDYPYKQGHSLSKITSYKIVVFGLHCLHWKYPPLEALGRVFWMFQRLTSGAGKKNLNISIFCPAHHIHKDTPGSEQPFIPETVWLW